MPNETEPASPVESAVLTVRLSLTVSKQSVVFSSSLQSPIL